jgi:hypothetical protein
MVDVITAISFPSRFYGIGPIQIERDTIRGYYRDRAVGLSIDLWQDAETTRQRKKTVFLVYLVCLVYLAKPDRPDEPDKQNKPV